MKLSSFIKFKRKPNKNMFPNSPFQPDRDWAILLGVFAVFFIACAVWGVFTYFDENNGGSSSSETVAEKTAREVRIIKEFFAEREKFEVASTTAVAEPSL